MPASAAERIRALIANAAASGCAFDINEVYVKALIRCGVGREEAVELVAANDQDPVLRILHYAGESHNFAVLAVEEALTAA